MDAPAQSTGTPPPRLPPLFEGARWRLLLALVGLGLLQAALAAAAALGVRALFDVLGGSGGPAALPGLGPVSPLVAVGSLAVGAALSTLLLGRWTGALAESLGQQYVGAVRLQLLGHLFTLPPRRHQRMRHGHLMARLTGDLGAVRRWTGRTVAPLLAGAASFALLSAVLVALAPAVAAAAALIAGPLVGAAWWVSARLERALRAERAQRWALAGQVGERLAEAAVVQAHGQAGRELGRLHRRQQRLHNAAVLRAREAALLKALPPALATLLLGLLAAWGSVQVSSGAWSTGTLAGLLTLLALVLAPLRDFALGLAGWRHWRVSREKLSSFLLNAPLPACASPSDAATPAAVLRLEALQATPQAAPVDAVLGSTDTLAVQGGSGSGKSALLLAIAGLLVPAAGRVGFADANSAEARNDSSSAATRPAQAPIALVAADLPLLRGSVAGNLRYRRRRVSAEAMQQALLRAGVRALPAGAALALASPVAEGGRNLPRVLRARLALARALVDPPRVLLIDDFDDLIEGSPEADAPLAALLCDPPGVLIVVTRSHLWAARCTQRLRLEAVEPRWVARKLELDHAARA